MVLAAMAVCCAALPAHPGEGQRHRRSRCARAALPPLTPHPPPGPAGRGGDCGGTELTMPRVWSQIPDTLVGGMGTWEISALCPPFCEKGTRFLGNKALRAPLTCTVQVGRLPMRSRGTCWVCAKDLSVPLWLWENSQHSVGSDCSETLSSVPLESRRSPKKQSDLGRRPARAGDMRVPSKAGLRWL